MTVCIAQSHYDEKGTPVILTASDRRISLLGGWFSQKGAVKFESISLDWMAMFAGGVEETHAITQAMRVAMAKLENKAFDAVLNCCRKAYIRQYRRLVETMILPNYDVGTYREYLTLRKTDEAFFLGIQKDIRQQSEDWSLLIAGFDNKRSPHIFVLHGPGSVQYCDQQKRAAIGIGQAAALMWLAYYECPESAPLGQAIFGVASAKFFAEKASDVGAETLLTVMVPGENFAVVFENRKIEELRQKWEAIPLIPDHASITDIQRYAATQFAIFKVMTLGAQKSAQAQ